MMGSYMTFVIVILGAMIVATIAIMIVRASECSMCQKTVWPGQQSKLSPQPRHLKCHQKIISDAIKRNSKLSEGFKWEISDFESKTGMATGLKINSDVSNWDVSAVTDKGDHK